MAAERVRISPWEHFWLQNSHQQRSDIASSPSLHLTFLLLDTSLAIKTYELCLVLVLVLVRCNSNCELIVIADISVNSAFFLIVVVLSYTSQLLFWYCKTERYFKANDIIYC